LLNDTLLVAQAGDLWAGSVLVPLNITEIASVSSTFAVWTGSRPDGKADDESGRWLGAPFANNGSTTQTLNGWISSGTLPTSNFRPVFGVSDVLTVVPEPGTPALLGLGLVALALRRRRAASRVCRSGAPVFLLIAIAALAQPLRASALVIDDFEQGAFSVLDTTTGVGGFSDFQTGLSPASVIGGTRLVSGFHDTGTQTSANLTLSASDDSVLFSQDTNGPTAITWDGVPDIFNAGTNGLLFADFSANGNRFAVDVTSLTGSFFLAIQVFDADSLDTSVQLVSAAGVVQIPFSLFPGIDFSDVRSMQMSVQSNFGGDASISSVGVVPVPEPSAALLVLLSLAGLGLRTR